MKHTRHRGGATMIGFVAAASLLVACGGDDEAADPEPAAEPTDEPAAEPAAELADEAADPEPAAEPTDEPQVIEEGEVYFLREGAGRVTVSLSDGSTYSFDTTCGVYIDRFEETYEHQADDGSFQWYSNNTDDGVFANMSVLLDEFSFSANAAGGFDIAPSGNDFDASVDGLVPGQGTDTVTAQVESMCSE